MVSPWMENENVLCYLQNNQDADRRQLVFNSYIVYAMKSIQSTVFQVNGIALGMHYLHTLDPPVIHGDLRGVSGMLSILIYDHY